MKNWSQHFEIVYKKFYTSMLGHGAAPNAISQRTLATFLHVSNGKVDAWKRGQWPSAEDLAVIAEKLGFSYRWLVTGQGAPEEEGVQKDAVRIAILEEEIAHIRAELEEENSRLETALEAAETARNVAEAEAKAAKNELLALYRELSGKSGRG